jgi:hypothetical protein
VVVRQDDALRVNDEAAADPARRPTRATAQHVEERVVAVVVVLAVVVLVGDLRGGGHGVDVDDRRLDATGDLGERGRERFGRARDLRGRAGRVV